MNIAKHTTGRILALALIPVMLILSSCGMTLKEAGGMDVVDSSSGKVWKHASTCYEAVELGDKVGSLKVAKNYTLDLHEIEDMDADSWVATEEGDVLYADGVHLPSLAEMTPDGMLICVEATTIKVIHEIVESSVLSTIVNDYTGNQSVEYPASPFLRTYRLRFTSEAYEGLYYCLTYGEYAEDYVLGGVNYGKYFLYDAFDRRFVPVGDEIHTALGLD